MGAIFDPPRRLGREGPEERLENLLPMNLPSKKQPPLPNPLLHKCVEEREKTGKVSLHEPAVSLRRLVQMLAGL
jgi:hypothetical protein